MAWIGIILSILFLYLAFKKVSWLEIYKVLHSANYLYLIPALIFLIISYLLRAVMWKRIINTSENIDLKTAFSFLMIGFMANNILPARMGELVRAYLLGYKNNISKSFCLATIAIERTLDVFILLIFILVVILLSPFPTWSKNIGYFTGGIFLITMLFLFWLSSSQAPVEKVASRVFSFLPPKKQDWVSSKINSFILGLKVLKNKEDLLIVIFLSALIWLLGISVLYLTLTGLRVYVPFHGLFFILSVINLGVIIPSSPGYVGTYQFLCVSALSVFSVEKSLALGFSIVFHALWYFPLTLLGFYFLGRENLSLLQLKTIKSEI